MNNSAPDPFVDMFGAVEGLVDEAVLVRLLQSVGATPTAIYGRHGKSQLRQRLDGYNRAAHYAPWIVLVDLDHDAPCAPALRSAWLPNPAPSMCFRVVVRAIESWLMADAERIAEFMEISLARVPTNPDALPDPKRSLLDLARHSHRREIRAMLPRPSGGRAVGPAYAAQLIAFTAHRWRPDVAASASDSLRRCLRCLRHLIDTSRSSGTEVAKNAETP